jgi:hypothetical protein
MRITSQSGRSSNAQIFYVHERGNILVLTLSHFNAALIFSVFASTVFAITQRTTPRDMFRYGVYCFSLFMGGLIVAGWLMWLLRH